MYQDRRKFLRHSGIMLAGIGMYGLAACTNSRSTATEEEQTTQEQASNADNKTLFFKISLAQWSLHRMIEDGALDALNFAPYAKTTFGIDAVEYVNRFYAERVREKAFLNQWKQKAEDAGVKSLLIMVDDEGDLGDLDSNSRQQTVDNHKKWLDAAKFLGCHSIRVNAAGKGNQVDVGNAAAEGLAALGELAAPYGLNVLVENHGGYSSNGKWLAKVIEQAGRDNVGTLPDFGNFCIQKDDEGKCAIEYDRYDGVQTLMPFAKAVSAKSYNFDDSGQETTIDFTRMLKIVRDAGYNGYIGVEYEGSILSEKDGVIATKKLLETAGYKL
jgi:sugar phosphate isomerase/epimerase